jgi:hypothetical protein
MDDWKLPWEGGCRCGEVRFKVTEPPLLGTACHCLGCQRMTASAFALSLTLRESGFEITEGEPVLGGLQQQVRHLHCPACKSWMFTRFNEPAGFMNLRPTMLDDHAWFAPFAEFQTAEKLPWAATGARHSFVRWAEAADYGRLMSEYAAEAARPTAARSASGG